MSIKSKLVFKPLQEKDIKQVHKICSKIFGDSYSINEIKNYLKDDPLMSFVCLKDNSIIAYILTKQIMDEAHIHSIGVIQKYRGAKIGNKVINYLIDFCKKKNKKKLSLEVRSSNISAIKLYSSVGFVPVGRRKKYYKDGTDAILMDLVI